MLDKLIIPTEIKPFLGIAKAGFRIATTVGKELIHQGCKITTNLVLYPICKGVVERLEAKQTLAVHRQEKEVAQEQRKIQQLLAQKTNIQSEQD